MSIRRSVFAFIVIALVTTSVARAETIGNDAIDRGTVDGWVSNMQVNETDTFTNDTGSPLTINITKFDFYVQENRNRVTPFLVRVNGDNDFTVVAVGTTRTSLFDYDDIGAFSFPFDDLALPEVTLAPGETIAPGFLDANADGTESGTGGGVVSWSNGGDELWYTGGGGEGDSGSVEVGFEPTAGTSTLDLARDYSYNISFTTGPPPVPGDVDGDRDVDNDDYIIIRDHFFDPVNAIGINGDLSRDQFVGYEDYDIWLANFPTAPVPVPSPSVTAVLGNAVVPEPGSMTLLGIGIGFAIFALRRRSK